VSYAGLSLSVSLLAMRCGSCWWGEGDRPSDSSLIAVKEREGGTGSPSEPWACRSLGSKCRRPSQASCKLCPTRVWMPPPQTVEIIAIKQLTPITSQRRGRWLCGCLGFAYLNTDWQMLTSGGTGLASSQLFLWHQFSEPDYCQCPSVCRIELCPKGRAICASRALRNVGCMGCLGDRATLCGCGVLRFILSTLQAQGLIHGPQLPIVREVKLPVDGRWP
jgi:hypothetical protein